MKKNLNKFSQEDIEIAIKSFDDTYPILEVIYKNILEFSSNKNIEIKKILEKTITQLIVQVEGSIAYSVLIEIFGIGYENSEKIPAFFDIFKGIPPSSNPKLPWSFYAGQRYSEEYEKRFQDIQGSKQLTIKSVKDYKKLIQVKPNEFQIIFDRMKDSSRSLRSKELIDLYTAICFSEDLENELETISINHEEKFIKKPVKDKKELRKEVFDMCKEYYQIFKKDINPNDYKDPINESLNWSNLIQKCDNFKNKLVEFREKDVSIFNNFKKTKEELLCIEVKDVLTNNECEINILPSSTVLNKLLGGSGVVKKIGKEIGYNDFVKIYQQWIIEFLDSELKIRSQLQNKHSETSKLL